MTRLLLRFFLFTVIIAVCSNLPSSVLAELYRYKDDQGRTHYANRLETIPERYRGSAKTEIRGISKSTAAKYSSSVSNRANVNSVKSGKVEYYGVSWCKYCQKLEKFFAVNNIKAVKHDIEKNPVAKAQYQKQGFQGVPVTKIGNQIIRGYDVVALRQALGLS